MIWQVGSGSHVPCVVLPRGQKSGCLPNGLEVECFVYAPSLAQHMQSSALIISHAGSGSVFEALRLRKPLIAVPNVILMANHQVRIAFSIWCWTEPMEILGWLTHLRDSHSSVMATLWLSVGYHCNLAD